MRRAARPLMYVGVLGIVFGLAKIHATAIGHYDLTGSARFGWTIAYAGILAVIAYGFGLPDVPTSRRSAVGASVGAAFVGALSISVIQLFVGDALLPRFVVFGSALLLPDWYRICVGLAAGGRLRAAARDRVIAVGTSEELLTLGRELQASAERPAEIVGLMSVAEAIERNGAPGPIEALAALRRPTVVVLDREARADPTIVSQVAALHERGVRVRSLAHFYEEWLAKLPLSELERAFLLFDVGELHRPGYARVKRALDVPLALLGLVALVAVAPIVWIGDRVANRGPLLYRQVRVGKGGVHFTILKFRTMRPRSSGDLADEWATEDDPRITRFGRILRKTHVDELPQVVNVLRGDLSIVGPRPEQPRYVDELTARLPFYRLRHLVRPGLTGWAQVKYGYAGSEADALQKLQYEFWYLRHQDVRTDVRIIGRTIRSVLGSEGKGR